MSILRSQTKTQSKTLKQQVDDWIKYPPPSTIRIAITPELAKIMLEYGGKQRPLSLGIVRHYARQMAEGKWRTTKAPIVFSKGGALLDGQHRLHAIIRSGVPIAFEAAFGDDDENFYNYDVGKKRSASDIFSINGVKNAKNAAAATSIVSQYLRRKMDVHLSNSNTGFTPEELYDEYLSLPNLDDSHFVATLFARNGLAPPSLMMAAHYICAQKSRSEADNFFSRLGKGLFKNQKDPAYKLNRILIKSASSNERLRRKALLGLVITAWNMARGAPGVRLKYDPEKTFPRAK